MVSTTHTAIRKANKVHHGQCNKNAMFRKVICYAKCNKIAMSMHIAQCIAFQFSQKKEALKNCKRIWHGHFAV